MTIHGLQDAVFLSRENRFAAKVLLGGRVLPCHVPNSGRLSELLITGVHARVVPFRGGGRTACGLVMIRNLGHWVVIDAHRANAVAEEAILSGLVPGLGCVSALRREVTRGNSRFDITCDVDNKTHFFEVKCSTLQRGGVAMFPDAPTERGRKHLAELAAMTGEGIPCHVLFILQHPAARRFMPNAETDPDFARLLREAGRAGVRIHALACDIDENSVQAIHAVEVEM